jgi:hypothetical protein
MLRARRFLSVASRWAFSPAPLSAAFTGEVFIGGAGLLGGGGERPPLTGPLLAASCAPSPCAPPPHEAYAANNFAEGVYTYSVNDAAVGSMLVARTAFGDGIFEDSEKRCYAVDGGAIAVMTGALVPPLLRLFAEQGKRQPFSLGHFVRLPAVRVTAAGGIFNFVALDGELPVLKLDTAGGDGGGEEAGGEGTGGEAALKETLGEAAGVPAPELLRALQERPGDAALALSVCKVLFFRAGLADERGPDDGGAARRALATAVLEGGGMQLLRVALEGHHRAELVALFGFSVVESLSEAGWGGFSQQAAPLLPTFAAALEKHEVGGKPAMQALRALGCVLENPAVVPAALAAGLPAVVTAHLERSLGNEAAAAHALFALIPLAEAPGGLEGTDVVPAVEGAVRAFPDTSVAELGRAFLNMLAVREKLMPKK